MLIHKEDAPWKVVPKTGAAAKQHPPQGLKCLKLLIFIRQIQLSTIKHFTYYYY